MERDSRCQLFWKSCFGCHKCVSPHGWIWTTCHLVLTYLNLNIQMVVSQFQIGTAAESHYLKSGKFCTWLSISIFLGKHESCSPILTYQVIALSITIPVSHMFYLASAVSENFIITQANFEAHIIKFGNLQFVERKCQSLNMNVKRWI